jgi:hypothetical protein
VIEVRIWVVIRYRFSRNVGAEQGMKLSRYVLENFMVPLDHDYHDGHEDHDRDGKHGRGAKMDIGGFGWGNLWLAKPAAFEETCGQIISRIQPSGRN